MEYPVSAVRNTCFAILSSIESDLRQIVAEAALQGDEFDILPDDVRQVASERFAADNKDRPGTSPENDLDLLDYTDFTDLAKMIRSKANLLATSYGFDPTAIASQIERMAGARNRVCHSRPLEEDDLPNFLDLAKNLLNGYSTVPWTNLKGVRELDKRDPTAFLRLQIPAFWQASTRAVPHNLPYPDFDETSFLGRISERREVRRHILGPYPVVTIVGEGGVGKSALAVRCLYDLLELGDELPFDAIVWISLKTKALTASGVGEIRDSITTTLGVVRAAATNLGAPASDQDNIEKTTQELIDYMSLFRILLVIDNYETLSVNSLRPLLSSVPNRSKVLITSRIGIGELELRYKLDPLDSKTAVILARKFAKSLNLQTIVSAPESRLEKYTKALYRNPLLIKWFVQIISSGADPEKIVAKRGAAFETALKFCFENLFSRLSEEEKEILNFLSAARRALTFTELTFLLQQVCQLDQFKLEVALMTLHSNSMLKRTPIDSRRSEAGTQVTLTDVAADYIGRFAPPPKKMIENVQLALKKLREMVEVSTVRQNIYKFDLYAIAAQTRDERISATYLNTALKLLRGNDLDGARKNVEQSKNLLPTFSEAYRINALIETRAGDFYKAEEEIKAAMQHNSTSVIARYQYALFLVDSMEDMQKALIELDEALAIEPQDVTLRTLRAMVLTRLGRCKEASEIYEEVLQSIQIRPRKWRISTRDQAAECFRRLSEQEVAMGDEALAKTHLSHALSILEEALASQDIDDRMGAVLAQVVEDSLFLAVRTNDASFAIRQLSRFLDARHALTPKPFRRLVLDHITKGFGEGAEVSIKAANAGALILWAQRYPTTTPPTVTARHVGTVKAIPAGVNYGFVIDSSGQDWFLHKSSLRKPELWQQLQVGASVAFRGGRDHRGRKRAEDVEVLQPEYGS